ncbi:MAG: MMPL family transporter, partial [Dehalococcoidia bacterium]|nr:MMPL family transporter [Dehalococcoidia bacterium]
ENMWHLTKLGIRFRWLTILLAIVLTGAALWGTFQLKTEMIPNIEFPFTSVIVVYPGALPEEVVSEVTVPVEDVIWERFKGQGLKHISSTSASGVSVIFNTFDYGTNMGDTNRVIEEAIDGISLPDEVRQLESNPQIIPIDPNQMPVVILSLSGDYSPYQLKTIAEDKFIPVITQIEGVYTAEVEGGDKERIIISPDPQHLVTSDISVYQITSLLDDQYDSLEAIRNAPMGVDSIVLGNIASVGPGPAPNTVITRTNGEASVTINVMKYTDANTVNTANAVMESAREIEADLNGDITVVPLLDQSEFIEDSVNQLLQMAIIGFILAIFVVFFFLRAFRASLVTSMSIPVSVLIGFLIMYFSNLTINLLTLSAMAIAVGRLIDNSIVVTEVIYRRIKAGEDWQEAAIGGAKEVAAPLTSATLATVAIFLPLVFVGGIIGELFVPFALTITFALIASLLVALIVVPAFSKWFVGKKSNGKQEKKAQSGQTWYQRRYVSVLKWALGHRAIVMVITFILFFGSIMLIPLIGTSFLGHMSEPMLVIQIGLPPGTELQETSDVVAQVESVIENDVQDMQYYWSTIGTSASLFGVISTIAGGGDNTAEINIMLEDDTDMKKERDALDKSLDDLRDSIGFDFVKVLTSEEADAGFMGGGVNLQVVGESRDEVNHAAELLYERLLEVEGISNLETQLTLVVPILDIELDPDKMSAMGLSDAQKEAAHQETYLLKAGTSSDDVLVSIDGESYGITLKGISQDLYIADDPEGLTEALPMGYPVFGNLGSIADVDLPLSPTHISHYDLQLSASITGTVAEKDAGAVNREVNDIVDDVLATPGLEGVDVKMGGMFEEMAEGFSSMGIAIIAASFIAFLILVISMRSVFNPLIIMVSLPLASIGAILALLISGHTLGMSGMMGILMLIGIVLTNAIVLIALVVQLRKSGMSTYDALIEGGQTRLRPILMTAITTMIAMIPLAVGVGAGTFIAAELAIVVIGGLFTSTLLTLIVIPVIYSLADGLRNRKRE